MVTSRDRPLMSQWNDKRSIPWGVNRNRDFAWTVLNRFFFYIGIIEKRWMWEHAKVVFWLLYHSLHLLRSMASSHRQQPYGIGIIIFSTSLFFMIKRMFKFFIFRVWVNFIRACSLKTWHKLSPELYIAYSFFGNCIVRVLIWTSLYFFIIRFLGCIHWRLFKEWIKSVGGSRLFLWRGFGYGSFSEYGHFGRCVF